MRVRPKTTHQGFLADGTECCVLEDTRSVLVYKPCTVLSSQLACAVSQAHSEGQSFECDIFGEIDFVVDASTIATLLLNNAKSCGYVTLQALAKHAVNHMPFVECEPDGTVEIFTPKVTSGCRSLKERRFRDWGVRQGFVYFIREGTSNFVKVGWSTDVKRRLKSLATGNAAELICLTYVPATFTREAQLHKICGHARVRGEWFDLTDKVVARIVALAIACRAQGQFWCLFDGPRTKLWKLPRKPLVIQ